MLSILFCVERLRGYSPGAPNINVPLPPFSTLIPQREKESRFRFLSVPFSISTSSTVLSPLSRTRAYCVFRHFRLSRGLFFLSTADVSAYIAERRRINSQVLSDTIRKDNGSLCFFPGGGSGPSGRELRAVSRRLKNGKGEKDGAGRGCFAPESRSLTTIHLNRASNIVRARCTIHRRNKEAFLQGNLCNIQALLSAFWRVLPLHFYSSRPSQVSAFMTLYVTFEETPLPRGRYVKLTLSCNYLLFLLIINAL